jgi:hypothetical protein
LSGLLRQGYEAHGDGAHGGDTHAILDHELRQPLAVDEDDLVRDALRVIERVFVEVAGGDEDALRRMLARQRAHETLDRLPPHRALPALRLHVDDIQPQAVLADDAVDAAPRRSVPKRA